MPNFPIPFLTASTKFPIPLFRRKKAKPVPIILGLEIVELWWISTVRYIHVACTVTALRFVVLTLPCRGRDTRLHSKLLCSICRWGHLLFVGWSNRTAQNLIMWGCPLEIWYHETRARSEWIGMKVVWGTTKRKIRVDLTPRHTQCQSFLYHPRVSLHLSRSLLRFRPYESCQLLTI